jgi:preprotein translocase subunit SecB
MQLKLIKTFVKELNFNQIDPGDESDNKLKFGLSAGWNQDEPSCGFSVSFDFYLCDSSGYEIKLQYEGIFETDEIVDEQFMESPWPQVNGAAIVYPFLRAFISNLTINSGYEAAVIPSVNFQQMYTEQVEIAKAESERANLESL